MSPWAIQSHPHSQYCLSFSLSTYIPHNQIQSSRRLAEPQVHVVCSGSECFLRLTAYPILARLSGVFSSTAGLPYCPGDTSYIYMRICHLCSSNARERERDIRLDFWCQAVCHRCSCISGATLMARFRSMCVSPRSYIWGKKCASLQIGHELRAFGGARLL